MWVNRIELDGDFHKLGFKEGFLCVAYKYDFNRPVLLVITMLDWVCLGLMIQLFIKATQLDQPFMGTVSYALGAVMGIKLYLDHLACAEWRLLQMLRRMS